MGIDVSKYRKGRFINLDNFGDKPRIEVIERVEESQKYDKPILMLKRGDKFPLNGTNFEEMIKAYGEDTDQWAGISVRLHKGEVPFNKGKTASIILTTIAQDEEFAAPAKSKPRATRADVNRPLPPPDDDEDNARWKVPPAE
jgi:hypothetical protein